MNRLNKLLIMKAGGCNYARTAVWRARTLLICSFLLVFSNPALSTTRNSMSIDQITAEAELIFEGEVLAHEAQRDTTSNLIYTYVTFAVHDVIKGAYSGAQLQLRFTGGTVGNEIVEITGLTLPAEGEQGIYFIESLSRNLLNPLLGWSQGHYLIEDANGERVIRTLTRDPVIAVQPVNSIPSTIRRAQRLVEGNAEVADGVLTRPRFTGTSPAMTVDEFKDSIRSLLP